MYSLPRSIFDSYDDIKYLSLADYLMTLNPNERPNIAEWPVMEAQSRLH